MVEYYTGYCIGLKLCKEDADWLVATYSGLERIVEYVDDEEGDYNDPTIAELTKKCLGVHYSLEDDDPAYLPEMQVHTDPAGDTVVYLYHLDASMTDIGLVCSWLATMLNQRPDDRELWLEWGNWADRKVTDGFGGGTARIVAGNYSIALTGSDMVREALRAHMSKKLS